MSKLGLVSKDGSPCGITTEHTVWCSQCIEWYQASIALKSNFISHIRSAGWVMQKGRWLCPNCFAKHRVDREASGE